MQLVRRIESIGQIKYYVDYFQHRLIVNLGDT